VAIVSDLSWTQLKKSFRGVTRPEKHTSGKVWSREHSKNPGKCGPENTAKIRVPEAGFRPEFVGRPREGSGAG